MFTEASMKIGDRLRRLVWRSQTKTYRVWIGSTVVSMFAFKSFVVALGPSDTRECAPPCGNAFFAVQNVVGTGIKTVPRVDLRLADEARMAANGTYANRKYAETNDNPIYR